MTNALSRYLDRVRALGCLLCQRLGYSETPASLHHPRTGQGMSQKASDWCVIPLCHEHHQGDSGIHGTRSAWKQAQVDEMDLLGEVNQRLNS